MLRLAVLEGLILGTMNLFMAVVELLPHLPRWTDS